MNDGFAGPRDGDRLSGAGPATDAPRVVAIDHVADVGFEVHAATIAELFHIAGRALRLMLEDADVEMAGERSLGPATDAAIAAGIALTAPDASVLLAEWLREILYLHEVHRMAYASALFHELDERRLRADIWFEPVGDGPARELKGVTYHDLVVEESAAGWRANVILDV